MLKKLKSIILVSGLSLALAGGLSPVPASAQLFDGSKDDACEALNATNSTPVAGQDENACGTGNEGRLNRIITTVINLFSIVIGVVAVIMIIIAGLKYITSQGDSNSVSSAKDTLLYAVIGIVIVVSAQLIVKFVLQRTNNAPQSPAPTLKPGQPI